MCARKGDYPRSKSLMSTVSASQNMAQPNQQNSSYDLSDTSMKRKRGRPRKDEVSGSERNKRNEQCTVLRSPSSNDGLVGREVSCSFIGVFDAGYLLSVQVGSSGPILRGMVFDPHLSVPVSAENDIAPHLPMLRRNSVSPPVEGASIAQKAGSIQHIQDKETPTTSSFTSHVQTDLQQNMMEVTPSYNSHVPQSASEAMEPQYMPKTLKVFLEGAAAETSDQSPLTSSSHLQSEAKSEHSPISAGLLDISMEAPASRPSEVSEAVAHSSSEPLNIRKEALSTTTEASLDVYSKSPFNISKLSDASKEAPSAVFKPSEASVIAQNVILAEQKYSVEPAHILQHPSLKTGGMAFENLSSEKSSQRTEEPSEDELLAAHISYSVIPIGSKPDGGGKIAVAEKLENAPTASQVSTYQP